MKHVYQTILIVFFSLLWYVSPAQILLAGLVSFDEKPLEGAEVQVDLGKTVFTGSDGSFLLEAKKESQWIRFSYMEKSKTMDISPYTENGQHVHFTFIFDNDNWPVDNKLKIQFKEMGPHVGQKFNIAVMDMNSEKVRDRKTDMTIEQSEFEMELLGLELSNSYYIDFFADHNTNGQYDSPPEDHAWRIEIDDVKGDTSLIFTHNTDFTEIDWINSESEVDEDTTIYFIVDEMPSYPGGEDGLQDSLTKYTFYPENAVEEGIEGTVYVEFVVEKDASISNIEVTRGISTILDSAAITIVESLPNFTWPGFTDGKPKRVSYTVPITFTLPVVALKLIKKDIDFTIYPNPSQDFINISLTNLNSFKYLIRDLNGKVVKSGKSSLKLTKIAIHDLKKGSYILQIRNIDTTVSKPFFVH